MHGAMPSCWVRDTGLSLAAATNGLAARAGVHGLAPPANPGRRAAVFRYHLRLMYTPNDHPAPSSAMPPAGFSAPFARVVADYVVAQGLDAAPVHQALGLGNAQLNDEHLRVPSARLAQALAVAAHLCGDPHAPLRIASFVRPAHLGSLGYAVMSVASGGDGLALFEQLQALLCTEIRGHHQVVGQAIETRQELLGPVPRSTEFWIFFVAARLGFARWVSGRALVPVRLDLPCPPPADPRPLLQFVEAPVRFDMPQCREVMPVDWLAWANPNADPAVHALMSSQAGQRLQALRHDAGEAVAQLRQQIAHSLRTEGQVPPLEVLAQRLAQPGAPGAAASARQLQRRLAEQGLNFKSLVEQVRREQALNDLEHTDLPLADVARRAGYADTSTFHRAVRRWTDQTPLAVREQARQRIGASPR
ncbi:AraC family transcriptional regulator [Aquabacterium soli]|uniref:AraC family transcriptional regulator n=2 Tax=Aquabacterium soli TaxID=2493092 RepID=A0A3R8S9W9_9BURK|nr:AraC family transcriptional regulator [Aquabacterium soli]